MQFFSFAVSVSKILKGFAAELGGALELWDCVDPGILQPLKYYLWQLVVVCRKVELWHSGVLGRK